MVEHLVSPHPAGGRGFVKSFVMVRHYPSLAEHEIHMVAGGIAPGVGFHAGSGLIGLSRKSRLQLKGPARPHIGQNKVQLPGGAVARRALRGNGR